jgi:hypothetical protein
MEEGTFVLCILLFGVLDGVEGIQGTWTLEPFQERTAMGAASVGEYAIFVGGLSSQSSVVLNRVELYKPQTRVNFSHLLIQTYLS